MNDDDLPFEGQESIPEGQTETERLRLQVMRLCRAVPSGQVTSYGELGAQCDPPISGYICGRVMGNVMDDVPWWRIVGKDGNLPISKRGPLHSLEQRTRLEAEGIHFDAAGKIERRFFQTAPDDSEEDEQGTLF